MLLNINCYFWIVRRLCFKTNYILWKTGEIGKKTMNNYPSSERWKIKRVPQNKLRGKTWREVTYASHIFITMDHIQYYACFCRATKLCNRKFNEYHTKHVRNWFKLFYYKYKRLLLKCPLVELMQLIQTGM